jgi:hypothetical protein
MPKLFLEQSAINKMQCITLHGLTYSVDWYVCFDASQENQKKQLVLAEVIGF